MFLLERQFVLAFWGNAESSFCFSWAFSILLLYSFVVFVCLGYDLLCLCCVVDFIVCYSGALFVFLAISGIL